MSTGGAIRLATSLCRRVGEERRSIGLTAVGLTYGTSASLHLLATSSIPIPFVRSPTSIRTPTRIRRPSSSWAPTTLLTSYRASRSTSTYLDSHPFHIVAVIRSSSAYSWIGTSLDANLQKERSNSRIGQVAPITAVAPFGRRTGKVPQREGP